MEFFLEFRCVDGSPVYRRDLRRLGLADLDRIRTVFGPGVLPEQIEAETIRNAVYSSGFPLSEQEAREACARSGMFAHTDKEVVYVPAESLSKYTEEVPICTARRRYTIMVGLDHNQVLKAWMDAGCPREWQP